jgi:hypothetical protein
MYAQQLCRAERSSRIENITSLIKCTGILSTAATRQTHIAWKTLILRRAIMSFLFYSALCKNTTLLLQTIWPTKFQIISSLKRNSSRRKKWLSFIHYASVNLRKKKNFTRRLSRYDVVNSILYVILTSKS